MYVAWTWATIWHRDPTATARLARREDPGRAVTDGLLLVASMASVLAVVLAIIAGTAGGPGERDLRAALAVASEAAWRLLPLRGAPPMSRFTAWVLTQECTIDISKAKRELGYRPIVSREEGLDELRAAAA